MTASRKNRAAGRGARSRGGCPLRSIAASSPSTARLPGPRCPAGVDRSRKTSASANTWCRLQRPAMRSPRRQRLASGARLESPRSSDVSQSPPQGGACFVRFSKGVAVRVFEIQIAALLGQDVEDGGASELVRLRHHVQILPCQIASTIVVDGDRAARAVIVSFGGGNLCLRGQLCRVESCRRPCSRRLRRGNLPLVPVAQRNSKRRPSAQVMKESSNARELPLRVQPELRKAGVHP